MSPTDLPAPPPEEEAPSFDINPQVVFRLGDELISDELQALVELVKNSYDASATSVVVKIDTQSPVEIVSEAEKPSRRAKKPDTARTGWLQVRDDGDGMTREDLDHGWLLISTLNKREMKSDKKTNRLGRTPLGDKGLGRLGVLRIGEQVEIRTRPRNAPEEHILRFRRADFARQQALSDVRPHYEWRPLKRDTKAPGGWSVATPFETDVTCDPVAGRQGTVIRVTALSNTSVWTDGQHIEQEMLSLISPFYQIEQFSLSVYLNEPQQANPLPLGRVADLRRDLADLRWSFVFDGTHLRLSGRFKLDAFKPSDNNEERSAFWKAHVAPDSGKAFAQRLAKGLPDAYKVKRGSAPWWLAIEVAVALSDIPAPGRTKRSRKDVHPVEWADPGPFSGELDSYNLGSDVDLNTSAFESFQLYKNWVRDMRGVKIFRDGFGIRVSDDFLRLGTGSTGGRSYWALRPGNTVGYIKLSARENSQLEETTDREGFVSNDPYQTFTALMTTFVDRANLVQTQIGRELSSWASESDLPVPERPSVKAAQLAQAVAEREGRTRETMVAVVSAQRALSELADGSALITTEQMHEARRASELLSRLQELTEEGESLQRDLDELGASSKALEREQTQLREQLQVAYQTVGLGIVAETVAHEMTGITSRLQARADALGPQFKGPEQRAARALASEVKQAVRAIRLQLRHLEPQLRYQQARREDVSILAIAGEVADYHRSRLSPLGIAIDVTGRGFQAYVNRGRLQQALDNLIINSEFWLAHAGAKNPRIELAVKPRQIVVRDNGPGVDPGLEGAIFEPFVSGRSGSEGRGLGLFIARQVLGADDVTIDLGEPSKDGRRRSFILDLSEAAK